MTYSSSLLFLLLTLLLSATHHFLAQETCSLRRNDVPSVLATPSFCFPTNSMSYTLHGQKEAVESFCSSVNTLKASWTSDGLREKLDRLRAIYSEHRTYLSFWSNVPWIYYDDPFICERAGASQTVVQPVRIHQPAPVPAPAPAPAPATTSSSSSSVLSSVLGALLDRVVSNRNDQTDAAERIHPPAASTPASAPSSSSSSESRRRRSEDRDRVEPEEESHEWGWALGDSWYNSDYSSTSRRRSDRGQIDRVPKKLDMPDFCMYRTSQPAVDKMCNSLWELKDVWDKKGPDSDMMYYLQSIYKNYKKYIPTGWVPPVYYVDVDSYNYDDINPYFGWNPYIDPLYYGNNFIGQTPSISYSTSYLHPVAPITQPILGTPIDPYLVGGAFFGGAGVYGGGGFGGVGIPYGAGGIGGVGGIPYGAGGASTYYGPAQQPEYPGQGYALDQYGAPIQNQYPVQQQQYPGQGYAVDQYGTPIQNQYPPATQQPTTYPQYPTQTQYPPTTQQPLPQYPVQTQQPTQAYPQQPQYPVQTQQPTQTYIQYPPANQQPLPQYPNPNPLGVTMGPEGLSFY
mmetsp:Transcript_1093/g.3750  ORF Transcript_1093/g.3750 Transcript_1093/m.3750 type:complete len:569 (-) Transcript_1093:208-1914(-)